MTEQARQPDIEVYLKLANAELIENWLSNHFAAHDLPRLNDIAFSKGQAIEGSVSNSEGKTTALLITPHAAGKAFCSIWFKTNITPWNNDLECAECILESNDIEVRCSASGWEESEETHSEQWWQLSRNEKRLIPWG